MLVHQDDRQTCPALDDGSVLMGSLFQWYKQNLGRLWCNCWTYFKDQSLTIDGLKGILCLSGVSSPMSLQGSSSVPVHNSIASPSLPSGFLSHLGTPSRFPPPSTLAPFTSLPPFPPPSSPAVPTFVSPPPSVPMMSSPPAGPPMSTFSVSAGHDITKGHAGRTPQTPLIPTFSSPVPSPGEAEPPPAVGLLDMLHVAPDVVQNWCKC